MTKMVYAHKTELDETWEERAMTGADGLSRLEDFDSNRDFGRF